MTRDSALQVAVCAGGLGTRIATGSRSEGRAGVTAGGAPGPQLQYLVDRPSREFLGDRRGRPERRPALLLPAHRRLRLALGNYSASRVLACPPVGSAYLVCHPALARQVQADLRLFDRTGLVYERVRTAMGNGMASAAHQDHRRQRPR